MNKPKIKDLLEIAEELFKDARGTTASEQKVINDFIRAKSKVILRKPIEKYKEF